MFKKSPQSGPMIAADMPSTATKSPPQMTTLAERQAKARPAVEPAIKTDWKIWLQTWLTALIGVGVGAYFVNRSMTQRMEAERKHDLALNAWTQLVSVGVDVDYDRPAADQQGILQYSALHFYNVGSVPELRKALIYSTLIPGVRSLSFRPKGEVTVGCGVADNTVLRMVTRNYDSLEVLDLTGTKIDDLSPLVEMPVKHLKIVNLPVLPDQFEWLTKMDSVTELWVGWPDRTLPKDSRYLSSNYKAKLIETVKSMKGLQAIHVHNIDLTDAERKQLEGLRIVPSYLSE